MSIREPLNASLKNNLCFGCGLENPDGLQIRIFRDEERPERLIGHFTPRPGHIGFTNILHGGLQFTALDCMGGWAMFLLRAPPWSMPLTLKATVRYSRAVVMGRPISLVAEIVREPATPRDPVGLYAAVLGEDGTPLTEVDMDYTTVPVDRFKKLVGIDALPEHYNAWFEDQPAIRAR